MQGSQFSMREVEVVTATVDLDEVASYRGAGEPCFVLSIKPLSRAWLTLTHSACQGLRGAACPVGRIVLHP